MTLWSTFQKKKANWYEIFCYGSRIFFVLWGQIGLLIELINLLVLTVRRLPDDLRALNKSLWLNHDERWHDQEGTTDPRIPRFHWFHENPYDFNHNQNT